MTQALHSQVHPETKHRSPAIHLGMAFDQNYLRHFYALLASVLHHNHRHALSLHLIVSGLQEPELATLKNYARQNNVALNIYPADTDTVSHFVTGGHWTSAAYYRLLFPVLVPTSCTRLLYLDTDTLVTGDLGPLFHTDLKGHPVGAVYDNWVGTAPQLGITEEGQYFNSGMMLMDLEQWREKNISAQVFAYLEKYPERIRFVDQCGLNAVLAGNWCQLEWKYNVLHARVPESMSAKQRKQFIQDKVILHFTMDRPWRMLCRHPYRRLYQMHLQKSPMGNASRYTDFTWSKIPAYIRLQVIEWYFNWPWLQKMWRQLKRK